MAILVPQIDLRPATDLSSHCVQLHRKADDGRLLKGANTTRGAGFWAELLAELRYREGLSWLTGC